MYTYFDLYKLEVIMSYSDYNISFGSKLSLSKKIKNHAQEDKLSKRVEVLKKIKKTAESKMLSPDIFARHGIDTETADIFVNANKPIIRRIMDDFYSKISRTKTKKI